MKVMVATAFLTLLIAVGWNRSYDEQFAAINTAYGDLLTKLQPQPPPASVEPIPVPTPAPEQSTVYTQLSPVAPPPASSGRNSSWMWNKSLLDNPRQSGVDRDGVHTFEPLMRNNP
jgi:hypothetical protein